VAKLYQSASCIPNLTRLASRWSIQLANSLLAYEYVFIQPVDQGITALTSFEKMLSFPEESTAVVT